MPLTFTENRQRNTGLSVSTNPRTVLRSNGLAEATQAEAIAGTIQHRYMSPLRVAQVLADGATGDLARVNDTNVTLTLGGTPADALWNDVTITVGWSGTLAASRGGFGADVSAQSGVPLFATGTPTFTSTTGTGDFVRATSPTLVTPALGTPSAAVLTNATGLPLSSGVTGDLPFANLTQGGAYTILLNNSGSTADVAAVSVSSLTEKTTLVADDLFLIQDSAASNAFKKVKWGAVGGGTLSATLIGASKVTLTNDTAATLTSISLTAGTWLVWGMAVFQPTASTTMKYGIGSISDTTNTINFTPPNLTYIPFFNQVVNDFATDPGFTVGPIFITVASTTTYYIVAQSGFAVSTNFAYGSIRALRIA